jgi:hypothetical protein
MAMSRHISEIPNGTNAGGIPDEQIVLNWSGRTETPNPFRVSEITTASSRLSKIPETKSFEVSIQEGRDQSRTKSRFFISREL